MSRIALFLGATAASAVGQGVSLAWNPSGSPGAVGYALYYGSISGVYTNRLDAGTNCATTLSGLTPGQAYYFVVATYGVSGQESGPSNEATFTVQPEITAGNLPTLQPPSCNGGALGLTWSAIVGRTYQVQYKTDLTQTNWLNLGNSIIATNTAESASDLLGPDNQRYYRILVCP